MNTVRAQAGLRAYLSAEWKLFLVHIDGFPYLYN